MDHPQEAHPDALAATLGLGPVSILQDPPHHQVLRGAHWDTGQSTVSWACGQTALALLAFLYHKVAAWEVPNVGARVPQVQG